MFNRQKTLLLITLISSILVFFVSNAFIFFGRSPFFSVRKNVYESYIEQVAGEYNGLLEQVEVFCRDWSDGPLARDIFRNFARRSRSREKAFPEVKGLHPAIVGLRCFNRNEREIFKWARRELSEEATPIPVKLGFFLVANSKSLFLGVGHHNPNLQDGRVLFEIDLRYLFGQIAQRRPYALELSSLRFLSPHFLVMSDQPNPLSDGVLSTLRDYVDGKNLLETRVYFPEHQVSVYSQSLFPTGLRYLYLHADNLFGISTLSLLWLLFLTLNCLLFFYLTFMFKEGEPSEVGVAPRKPKPKTMPAQQRRKPSSPSKKALPKKSKKDQSPNYDFDLSKSMSGARQRQLSASILSEVPEEFYRRKSRVNKGIVSLLNEIADEPTAPESPRPPTNFEALSKQLKQTETLFSREKARQMIPIVRKLCAPYAIHFIAVLARAKESYAPLQSHNLNKKRLVQFVLKSESDLVRAHLSLGKPVILRDRKSVQRLLRTVLIPIRNPKTGAEQLLFFPVLQKQSLEFVVVLA